MKVVLIGFMAAGKTSTARLLGERLGVGSYDSDLIIVDQIGMTIDEYFAKEGEPAFRKLEHDVIFKSLEKDGVVSTGGGCIETQSVQELLKDEEHVIYLKASFDELWERINSDKSVVRPLADPKEKAASRERYERRLPIYESLATHTIETDNIGVNEVADQIIEYLTEKGAL